MLTAYDPGLDTRCIIQNAWLSAKRMFEKAIKIVRNVQFIKLLKVL